MNKIKLIAISILCLLAFSTGAKAEFFSDVIVTSANGIWTDSRAYSTLNAAITAVGANQRTIKIVSPQVVTSLTIPSNVTLEFDRDGSIANSDQLTIQTKNIIAPNRQIFTGAGNIDFAPGSVIKTGWFNSIESAFALTTNDTVTLVVSKAQTITASYSPGTNVHLKWEAPGNILTINAGITVSNINQITAGNYQLFAGAGNFRFRDGTTLELSWFAHLRSAITYIDTNSITLISRTVSTVDWSNTISANTNLVLMKGAVLTGVNGITLTNNGIVDLSQGGKIFGSASGTFTFVNGAGGQFKGGDGCFANIATLAVMGIATLKPQFFGAAMDGVTDDILPLRKSIESLRLGSGGEIIFDGMLKINDKLTLQGSLVSPSGYSPNFYGDITFRGTSANAGILSSITSGNVVQLGGASPGEEMGYVLSINNLIIDGGGHEVTVLHGGAAALDTHIVNFNNLQIRGFSGASSVAFDSGRISGSRIANLRIVGSGTGKGYIPRRALVQLLDPQILYCNDAIYIPAQSEAGIQIIGGGLLLSNHLITFEGGIGSKVHSFLMGTFLGENRNGMDIIHTESTATASSLSFYSCHMSSEDTSGTAPLLDFSGFENTKINLIGNVNFNVSTATDVLNTPSVEITMFGNTNITLNASADLTMVNRVLAVARQPSPATKTISASLTIAEILGGIIIGTHSAGSTQIYQVPSGTLSEGGASWSSDDSVDWTLINLSSGVANTITVAAETNHAFVGDGVIAAGGSATFRTRRIGLNTFVTYRK